MPNYILTISTYDSADAAPLEIYRRLVTTDKVDPIIEKLDKSLRKGRGPNKPKTEKPTS